MLDLLFFKSNVLWLCLSSCVQHDILLLDYIMLANELGFFVRLKEMLSFDFCFVVVIVISWERGLNGGLHLTLWMCVPAGLPDSHRGPQQAGPPGPGAHVRSGAGRGLLHPAGRPHAGRLRVRLHRQVSQNQRRVKHLNMIHDSYCLNQYTCTWVYRDTHMCL